MNVKLLFKNTLLLSLFLFASLTTVFSQDTDVKNDVMFQGFWWDSYQDPNVSAEGGLYNYLKARAPQLQAAGFDVVWTPPPSQGDGMGYFPKQLFNYNNAHGSEAQLRAMLTDFASRGIHGMADIIANHRSGTNGWSDFTNPTWDCSALVENDEVKGVAGQIQPCSGQNDEGEGFPGCRDLNHKSPQVQQGFRDYLNNLKGLGFDSWRYDFTKGFPAHYVGEYNGSSNPYFSVGEYWDANIGLLTSWVNNSGNTFTGTTKRSSTFDFSLYYILARAVNNGNWYELNNGGKMPGLAGTYGYADYAVTFVENHDTHEISGTTNILKANAYILTHPGIPMVFSKHWLDNKQKINELIAVRKQNNITAWSSVNVVESTGFYAAYIDNKVAVKIGSGMWSPTGTGWILNSSGTDYAVWSKINITTPEVTPEPFLNISLIGPAVGGWGTDLPMTTTDGITYRLYSQNIATGAVKFRANQSWSANWGAATFPSGTGVSYGAEIPAVAGQYNITFNRQTGAYSFSAPTSPPAHNYTLLTVVGPAVGGWGTDVLLPTNDGVTYTLTDYNFVGGSLKIRQDNAWTKNWGSAAFPSGTGIQDGADIPVPAGVYTLTFNILNGQYTFYGTDYKVGIIGTSVGGWVTDVDMVSKDNGVNYTLEHTFETGEVKFRKDDTWVVNWGNTSFPSGTGFQDGGNIPLNAGTYKVTFNAVTGVYNFELLGASISSFSPAGGSQGTVVTIVGNNLEGVSEVKFGGKSAESFTVDSPTQITATVSNGSSGSISLIKDSGTVNSIGSFLYIQPTKIVSTQCGNIISDLSSYIYCNLSSDAESYQFEVTENGVTRTFESATNKFRLTDLSGGASYGKSYSIKVAIKYGGVFGAYGEVCTINTPSGPSTKLVTSQCGSTLTIIDQLIYCNRIDTAEAYKFEVKKDGIAEEFVSNANNFKLTNLSAAFYNTTYAIRVSAKYNGVWAPYNASCNITTPTNPGSTKLVSNQCGVNISAVNTTLFATIVQGAQGYVFEVTNGGNTRTYESTDNKFNLDLLNGGGAYGTTYAIRVKVRYNSTLFTAYGASCNVTTPGTPPTTRLVTSQCGVTLSAINTAIFANLVSGIQGYRFQATLSGVSRTFETTTNKFSLTDLAGITNYGATYSIRVAVKLNNVWGAYGSACNVTTPSTVPSTRLVTSQCGVTLTSLNQIIYANLVSGVQGYIFEVTQGGTTRTFESTTNKFTLANLVGGGEYGKTYAVRVAVRYNTTSLVSSYGASCNITTPNASPKEALSEEITQTVLYPNPYSESFKIAFSGDDSTKVQVLIYDASGRLVSQKETASESFKTEELGQGFSSGVYTVQLQQGERIEVLRIVKQ